MKKLMICLMSVFILLVGRNIYAADVNNILNFGATPNDSTNDAPSIQRAINASYSNGNPVYIPDGIFQLYRSYGDYCLFIDRGVRIFGNGKKSYLHCSSGDAHIFKINTNNSVTLEDLYLTYSGWTIPDNGISCIFITAPDVNKNSNIRGVYTNNGNNGIRFHRAAYATVEYCKITNFYKNGIVVENLNNPDQGDSIINGCTIIGRIGSNASLKYISSGGLRFANNKILGSGKYGIEIYADGKGHPHKGLNSWIISNNSIEGVYKYQDWGIYVHCKDLYPNTSVISGNEITGGIFLDAKTSGQIFLINIAGNVLGGHGTTSDYTVKIRNCNGISISSNTIRNPGGGCIGVFNSINISKNRNLYFQCN